MDLSQKTLGAKIAALRKIRNMTQEQLAAQLGISAPAVSKWETGSSYPDITLLAPLARALGTNLDTLLQFEQTLSDQEVATQINLHDRACDWLSVRNLFRRGIYQHRDHRSGGHHTAER